MRLPQTRCIPVTPPARILFVLGLSALTLTACSSVSRQTTTTTTPSWWEEDDASAPVEGVTIEADVPTDGAEAPDHDVAMEHSAPETQVPADSLTEVDQGPSLSPEALAALQQAYGTRTTAQRERVRQVNDYARWCLDRSMWEEARIHLEQALAADSLAASLHNNLAIVYERMGRRDDARSHYQLAASLNPRRPLYEANLKRLRNAAEKPPPSRRDTTITDDILLPGSGDEYHPHVGATPKRPEDEAHSVLP